MHLLRSLQGHLQGKRSISGIKMAGFNDYKLRLIPAFLTHESIRKSTRKLIWPGFFKEDSGRLVARFSPKKSSAAITALLGTDGLIIQDPAEAKSEEVAVNVVRWRHIFKH